MWYLQEGEEDLIHLQAAIILSYSAVGDGQDKIGTNFLSLACNMAKNIGLFKDGISTNEPSTTSEMSDQQDKWDRAKSVTGWGVFIFQTVVSYTLQRAPFLRRPPAIPIPYEDENDFYKILFRAQCILALIQNDLGWQNFGDDDGTSGPVSIEMTESLYQRLLIWQNSLNSKLVVYPTAHWSSLLLQ